MGRVGSLVLHKRQLMRAQMQADPFVLERSKDAFFLAMEVDGFETELRCGPLSGVNYHR